MRNEIPQPKAKGFRIMATTSQKAGYEPFLEQSHLAYPQFLFEFGNK